MEALPLVVAGAVDLSLLVVGTAELVVASAVVDSVAEAVASGGKDQRERIMSALCVSGALHSK